MAKKEFTEEQMREFSKNAIPFITQLKEVAEHFGVTDGLRVYVSDGYLSLEGAGLCGWELHNYGGEYEMKFEKRVPLRKPICACAECGEAVYEQGDWDFNDGERIPVCRNCGAELQLPEGY